MLKTQHQIPSAHRRRAHRTPCDNRSGGIRRSRLGKWLGHRPQRQFMAIRQHPINDPPPRMAFFHSAMPRRPARTHGPDRPALRSHDPGQPPRLRRNITKRIAQRIQPPQQWLHRKGIIWQDHIWLIKIRLDIIETPHIRPTTGHPLPLGRPRIAPWIKQRKRAAFLASSTTSRPPPRRPFTAPLDLDTTRSNRHQPPRRRLGGQQDSQHSPAHPPRHRLPGPDHIQHDAQQSQQRPPVYLNGQVPVHRSIVSSIKQIKNTETDFVCKVKRALL